MKTVLNNRRWYIGGWFGLAVVLLTANLFKLSQLEFQPLGPSPAIIKQLRLRLLQFDELLSAQQMDSEAHLDLPIALTRLPKAASLVPKPQAGNADEFITPSNMANLPQLSGILQVLQEASAPHYSAVLDGRVYAEKDTVGGFRIEEISSRGIVLRQRDRRWFIPAPEVYYSIGQKP